MAPVESALAGIRETCSDIAFRALSTSRAASLALQPVSSGVAAEPPQAQGADLAKQVNALLGALELLHEQGVDLPGLYDRAQIDASKANLRSALRAGSNPIDTQRRKTEISRTTIDLYVRAISP